MAPDKFRLAPGTFRYALRGYQGLPLPGCSPPIHRLCAVCHMQMDTLGTHRLVTFPTSRSAFIRRHTSLNHTFRAPVHRPGYSTTLEPQLLDPISETGETGNVGPRSDFLVSRTKRLPKRFVDVAVTCPTAPSSSSAFRA